MTIPGFQQIMLPVLQMLADGEEQQTSELVPRLADKFGLTSEDRAVLNSVSRQPTFYNRTAWAITYLAKAGALQRTARGKIRITARGQQIVAENLATIDIRYLRRFEEFQGFRESLPENSTVDSATAIEAPDELLEANYQILRDALADDLLQRVKAVPPPFFEQLVVDLLVAMGYGGSHIEAGRAVGRSGDDGVDGIINEDKLGLDVVYIQAKRWQGPVGRPVVQAFAGSLEGHRARKGVLITTSYFTQDAAEYVGRIEKRIVLVDGERLIQLMIDHDIGVVDRDTYKVKRVDLDYFPDEVLAEPVSEQQP